VFDNLSKFVVWIVPTNLGEAFLLIGAIVMGWPLPALPLQLLWINLTDTVLGLPLAFEAPEPGCMTRPPRDPRQPILTAPLLMRAILVSVLMVAGGLGLFRWELHAGQAGLAAARTSVVNAIVLVEAVYLFNCRSLVRSVFRIGLFANRWAVAGCLGMFAGQLVFTYAPFMNRWFHSAPIAASSWVRIGALAAAVFWVVEAEKWMARRRGARSGRNRR
jgi:magnesium-transporting ATPase (P-type)